MAEPILRVENLVKHFPARGGGRGTIVHAVDGVSFGVAKGRTLGLVGESGCGKSTAARTIIRIYEPTAGKIFLEGVEIGGLSQKALKPFRRKIQMIFQDPFSSLNGRMTARDIITEPLAAHGIGSLREREDMAAEMLARVGLDKDHAARYAHEFSGGQRQRIGIARALILRPEIIICDEPISALDVSIQAQVVNLLKEFQDEAGLTYLFIAHDLSMVRYVSDDVGVMYLGKIVERGPCAEVYGRPLHPYTQALIRSAPVPDPSRSHTESPIEGDIPSPISPPPGCRFHTRCPRRLPRCREEEPALAEAAPGHFAACHLAAPPHSGVA